MLNLLRISEIVKDYLKHNFPYDPNKIALLPIVKPADLPAQWVVDNRPMFWVKDEAGKLLSVVKVIPTVAHESWQFANLESSIAHFNELHLKQSQTISILGNGRVRQHDIAMDICVISPAQGKSLQEILVEFRQASGKEQAAALHPIVREWAKVLVELHLAKAVKKRSFSEAQLEEDALAIKRLAAIVKTSPGLFPFGAQQFIDGMNLLRELAEKEDLYVGITHGDPDPTNVFFDAFSNQWTWVDIDELTKALNPKGNPVARIGNELIRAKLSLIKCGFFQRFSSDEIEEIGGEFQEQYQESAGPLYPTLEQRNYYSALYFSRKIAWISVLEERLRLAGKSLPDHFATANSYRKKLIQDLQDILKAYYTQEN